MIMGSFDRMTTENAHDHGAGGAGAEVILLERHLLAGTLPKA
jgi:hypothetical protein